MSLSTLIFKALRSKTNLGRTFWMFAGEAILRRGAAFDQSVGDARSHGAAAKETEERCRDQCSRLINLGGGHRQPLRADLRTAVHRAGDRLGTTTLFVFLIGVLLTPCCSRRSRREKL